MIEVKNLHKKFNKLHVLKGINCRISSQEVVCVIGPSGSGKSTFLRCINLLEEPTEGEIYIEKVKINDPKTNINTIRAEVGMVFQRFNLFPHKTALENITLAPAKVRNISKQEAEQEAHRLLKKVGLTDKANVYPDQLSGGQQQRVAIARALINEPDIILADEPIGNLDSKTGTDVMKLLQRINIKKGKTIVQVTHSKEAAEYGTRIINVRDGRICEQ